MRKYRRFPLRVAGHPHRYSVYLRELAGSWRELHHGPRAFLFTVVRWACTVAGRLWQAALRRWIRRLDAVASPPEGHAWHLIGNGRVLFKSLTSPVTIELDEVASRIFLCLLDGTATAEVARRLAREYDASQAEIETAVAEVVGEVRRLSVRCFSPYGDSRARPQSVSEGRRDPA